MGMGMDDDSWMDEDLKREREAKAEERAAKRAELEQFVLTIVRREMLHHLQTLHVPPKT